MEHPVQPLPNISVRQQLFVSFIVAVLIDLTVLNLFAEYWSYVIVISFTTSLWTAILLQALFRVTLYIDKRITGHFLGRGRRGDKLKALTLTWLVAFVIKLVTLRVIDMLFGDRLMFVGPYSGAIAFVVVVIVMLVAEDVMRRIFRSLG